MNSAGGAVGKWLTASGPEADVVLSTRVRLARNLADVRFTHRAERRDHERTIEAVRWALTDAGYLENGKFIENDQLAEPQGQYLIERHLASPDFVASKDDYLMIERRLKDLRERRAAHEKNAREQEAKAILSKVGLLILSYDRGHVAEAGPDKILPLMKQLKEKYDDTEAAEAGRRQWPAWYAGRVPQSASEVLAGGGLKKAWDAAVERSEKFRKEYLFREAKEAIERFVTEREAVLGAGDLETYERLRGEEIETIDRLADSVYRGRQSEAERPLKNKRYDDAIAAYQVVVEKFGIDAYVRKAQGEIAAEHGNDIARLVAHFRQQQAGRKDVACRAPKPVPSWKRTEEPATPS